MKQSKDKQNEANRKKYEKAYSGDLTTYAAMYGDTFSAKVNLLGQLIHDKHHQSLGIYKERLLRGAIIDYLPSRYAIGTGFVLFPERNLDQNKDTNAAMSADNAYHSVSSQLDLIIYDSHDYAPVFKDGDFVVLRPESVHVIIEVKGSLDRKEIVYSLEKYLEYSRKWKKTKAFYEDWTQIKIPVPRYCILAWMIGVDSKGNLRTDGKRIRDQVVSFYKDNIDLDNLRDTPVLDSLFVYNECIVQRIYWYESDRAQFGYDTSRGQYVKYVDGIPKLAGDKTIGDLLARISVSLNTPFNPSISYVDQSNRIDVLPHKHQGFTAWLTNDEGIKLIQIDNGQ